MTGFCLVMLNTDHHISYVHMTSVGAAADYLNMTSVERRRIFQAPHLHHGISRCICVRPGRRRAWAVPWARGFFL